MYQFKKSDLCVHNYFIKMKIIWDELNNLCPLPGSSCCAKDYIKQDYEVKFLKRLNDWFSIVRSQIILMETLPFVNKVFWSLFLFSKNVSWLTVITIKSVSIVVNHIIVVGVEPAICFNRASKQYRSFSSSNNNNKVCT